jgi:hypothetical protein
MTGKTRVPGPGTLRCWAEGRPLRHDEGETSSMTSSTSWLCRSPFDEANRKRASAREGAEAFRSRGRRRLAAFAEHLLRRLVDQPSLYFANCRLRALQVISSIGLRLGDVRPLLRRTWALILDIRGCDHRDGNGLFSARSPHLELLRNDQRA